MRDKKFGSKKALAIAVLLGLSTGLFMAPVQAATSTTYGDGSTATGANSTAYGYSVKADGDRSVAIGQDYPNTLDESGAEVTHDSTAAKGFYSVAIGAGAQAVTDGTIAMGALATAGLRYTHVDGDGEQELTNDNAVAIGRETGAIGVASVSLGAYSRAAGSNSIAIGGGNSGGNATYASGSNAISIGNMSIVKAANSLALGYNAQAGAAKSGSTAAQTDAIAFGSGSRALYMNAIAIGKSANTTAEGALAVGLSAKAAKNALALGSSADATQENAISLGNTSKVTEANGIAIGSTTEAAGTAVALGNVAKATATNVIAIGNEANSAVANSVVLGASASATAAGVALGYNASVTAENSVALGNNSVADSANVVSIGSSGSKRNLIYVADARGMTSNRGYEAVNWRQLISNNNGNPYTFAKGGDGKYVATIKTNATDAMGYTNGVAFELELPDVGTTIPVQTVKLSSDRRTYIEGEEEKEYDAKHNQIMGADGKPIVTFEMGKVASSTADDAATNGFLGFISGGDVWNETRKDIPETETDNNYIKQSNTAGANLKALDNVIGQVDKMPTAGESWNYIGQHGTNGDTTITVSDNLEALDQAIGKVSEGTYTFIKKTDGGAADGSDVSVADNLVNLDQGISKLIKPVGTDGKATKISIGDDTDYAGVTEVSFGQGSSTRKLTGITAGTDPTDAVNVSQLNVSLAAKTYAESNTVYFSEGEAVKDKDGNPIEDDEGNQIKETVINVKNLAMGTTASTVAAPTATGAGSIALGAGSSVTGANSVALGYGSVAGAANVISVGSGKTGDAYATRKIVNVAAGTQTTDAANYGQLINAQAETTGEGETTYTPYKFKDGVATIETNSGDVAFKLALPSGTIYDSEKAPEGDSGYITGSALYTELRSAITGTTNSGIAASKTAAENLMLLDKAIGNVPVKGTEATDSYNWISGYNATAQTGNNISQNLIALDKAIGKVSTPSEGSQYNAINTTNNISKNLEALDTAIAKLKLDGTYVFDLKEDTGSGVTKDISYANNGGKAFTITIKNTSGSSGGDSGSTGGGGKTYQAGNGITITNSTAEKPTISVNLAENSGLSVGGSGLSVKLAEGGGLSVNSDGLSVRTNGTIKSGDTGIVTGGTVYNALVKNEEYTAAHGQVEIKNNAGQTAFVIKGLDTSGVDLGDTSKLPAAGLGETVTDSVLTVNDKVGALSQDINRVGAGAAALAALHTEQYDPEDKWSFAVGYGHYRNANSGALGAFYKPNEDTTLSFAGTIGNGDAMLNAGVSFKLGQRGHSDLWRREKTMIERVDRLEANTSQQNARIDAQDRIIDMQTQQIESQARRIDVLEAQVAELRERAGLPLAPSSYYSH